MDKEACPEDNTKSGNHQKMEKIHVTSRTPPKKKNE